MRASQAILKTLIDAKGEVFRHCMTLSLSNTLDLFPTTHVGDLDWIKHPYPFLEKIDLSWLTGENLRLHELCQSNTSRIATFAKLTLWKNLAQDLPELLPFQAAKEQRLGNLLTLSKQECIKLFHLLGLFDLSLDLKKIVQTQTLQAIKSALNSAQTTFLQSLSHKTTSVDFGRLDLNRWDKQAKTLQDVLYNRGLNRLAKALVTASPSVIWYFEHTLDQTTGNKLKKLISDLKNPSAQQALLAEVQVAYEHVRRPV